MVENRQQTEVFPESQGAVTPAVPAPEEVEQETQHPDRHWYVIHTYSGYENKVKQNLEHRIASMGVEDKIFKVVVPTEEQIEIRGGQRHKVQRKVFPGYVLVDMILTDDSWYVVRNTPGVTSFVGSGNKPTPLDNSEVEAILKQMELEAPRVTVSLAVGQAVRIVDGPFTDFEGTVDEINNEKGKVKVLVSFFGRETPVELDFLQVEKII
ncbi:MAG: transcription termination/antitermination protein NusG [Chloroflexi bacterium]|nr:transcription termination/antitermination protein NusG [Chloroflexota bacterium]